ncbi:MAG: assimilatory sulfite reductase (NADPH) flavoprotein subunit [Gammaproteobacteria bacterium]|nr:assimilatory sulfite reductase (NADPH) flavoprotein subunit [Gammaproteobacteria bacterium]
MNAVVNLPVSPPLPEGKAPLLAQLTEGLDAASLWWLSGYAAGLAGRTGVAQADPILHSVAGANADVARLTIVYGSQTGNSKRLAERLAQQSESAGVAVRLLRADAYPLRELADERHLHVIISTQGDGDPPDDARGFVEYLLGKRAPRLPSLKFAVLGLGDSSYPKFCEIGRRLDARLEELGATRWLARADADLDLESIADPWIDQALALARDSLKANTPSATVTTLRPSPSANVYTREHPFAAELLANQRITGRGSHKDIRHIELSLEGSGLSYEPGDALGVWPVNPPKLVSEFLDTLGLDSDAIVNHGGQSLPLAQWLGHKRELTRLTRAFIASHAALAGDAELNRLLAPDQAPAFARLLSDTQPIELLQRSPAPWSAEELVAALRPLTPRLYSIASSQKSVGAEAHLTVAHVEYEDQGALRWGAASHYLASQDEGAKLPVYIERNDRFRLPTDPSRDLIMIGPGTGVAPYRGFLQDRIATGASGRHWLLFGNPHFRSDFLYQLEWQRALKQRQLHRLDLAFSRDGASKTYVQHRLREHGRDVYAWLENGAHLYVCGDATRMARDVHATLLSIIATHGGKDEDGAADYLSELQRQGRYARDVY